MNFLEEQKRNVRTTWLLSGVFFVLLTAAGVALDFILFNGRAFWITSLVAVFAIAQGLYAYYSGTEVMLRSVEAEPLDPTVSLKHRQALNILEELCLASGLPQPPLYVEPDDAINAFAAGRDPKHAVVCVTTGLIEKLDRNEVAGVLAHELAHIRNRDVLLFTIMAAFIGSVGLLAALAFRAVRGTRISRRSKNSGQIALALLLVAVVLWIASWLGKLLKFAVSRTREFLADATAVEFTREPEGLVEALTKIQREALETEYGTADMAHAYFAQPHFSANSFLATHPPLDERIARLRVWRPATESIESR
ncbi:MAG TPA: M48 family metallopeptidase [Verrucomicrobiae bacterium]|jgi:heat shock protein HtpX